jgi:hypothetical protein
VSGPLPAVAKAVRVEHHFTEAAAPNVMVRTFFQYTGALSTADATTWLGNIITGLNANMSANLQPTLTLLLSELTDLTSVSSAQVQSSVGFTGGATASPLAAGVAMVLRYRIARRYRGGHPRVYLPGMANAFLNTPTQWATASQASIVAAWVSYLAACTANTNPAAIGTITHINISYYQGFTVVTPPGKRAKNVPTPRVTPLVDPVINVSGNPKPGSQRRRNEQS